MFVTSYTVCVKVLHELPFSDVHGHDPVPMAPCGVARNQRAFPKLVSNPAPHQTRADDKDLEEFEPADLAMALCRMLSYNIGQLAYMNAVRYGLSRIFFGGFFIRGHPYTMETISFAIDFWSKARLAPVSANNPCFLVLARAWCRGARAALIFLKLPSL